MILNTANEVPSNNGFYLQATRGLFKQSDFKQRYRRMAFEVGIKRLETQNPGKKVQYQDKRRCGLTFAIEGRV